MDQIQRVILAGVTGVVRTTSLKAMEMLAELPPLDIQVRATAFKINYRLNNIDAIIWDGDLERKLVLGQVGGYRLSVRYIFDRRFVVLLSDEDEWRKGYKRNLGKRIVWYTDGSKGINGTGTGAWRAGSGIELFLKLDNHTTVFQAEVVAITEAAKAMLDDKTRSRNVSICSDEQAVLLALRGSVITSKEV